MKLNCYVCDQTISKYSIIPILVQDSYTIKTSMVSKSCYQLKDIPVLYILLVFHSLYQEGDRKIGKNVHERPALHQNKNWSDLILKSINKSGIRQQNIDV